MYENIKTLYVPQSNEHSLNNAYRNDNGNFVQHNSSQRAADKVSVKEYCRVLHQVNTNNFERYDTQSNFYSSNVKYYCGTSRTLE